MNPTVLSGEQLVNAHSRTDHELPTIGVKDFQPTHSWLENKQIQSALDSRKELLELERVEKWSSLMHAEWLPEKQKAALIDKGKPWEVFGHHSDNGDWLFPEEVLLLLEMNLLECLYGEVPLTIQRGYSVLLGPDSGCSLDEYRVFAHLCRAGYRVVRHLPELTVTAYERRVRLDQHLDQRTTYGELPLPNLPPEERPHPDLPAEELLHPDIPSDELPRSNLPPEELSRLDLPSKELSCPKLPQEELPHPNRLPVELSQLPRLDLPAKELPRPDLPAEELPRPDLPPKTILDLRNLDMEITIESSGPPAMKTEKKEGTKPTDAPAPAVEVIDIADSSSDSSDESSSDSDVEIIHVFKPAVGKTLPNIMGKKIDVTIKSDNDDDGLEVIEVPIPTKEIIVTTIESSDSESESDRSYDGNWKRKQNKQPMVRPDSMKNFTFSTVEEFCFHKTVNNENVDNTNSEDILRLSVSITESRRLKYCVNLNRTEILDLMPTMFGKMGKLMTLNCPDLRLIPGNITPKQPFYTYNMSTLRARTYSHNFRGYFRGRRNFHGPRFNSYNPNYNSVTNYSNPLAIMPGLPLTQMFGSDVQSVARGMMQFASALLMNMPHNRQDSLLPFNQTQLMPFSNNRDSHSFYSPPILNDTPRNFITPTHTRFSDSPMGSSSPNMMSTNDSFSNRSFGSDNVHSTRNSGTRNFESNERTFTPPRGRHFNSSNRFNRPRGHPNSRNKFIQNGSIVPPTKKFKAVDPVFPDIDPAYIKPDIPLSEQINKNSREDNDFISLGDDSSTKSLDVIEVVDLDLEPVEKPKGISCRFQPIPKKRKRRWRSIGKKMKRRLNSEEGGSEIIFLDSPNSETSVKQETDGSKDSIKMEQNCNVKQETVGVNQATEIKGERHDSSRLKVEDRDNTAVKSEIQPSTSSGVRVNIGQDCSGSNLFVQIKIEGSTETTPAVVKTENDVKTEPDSSSEIQSTSVKHEPSEVKEEPSSAEVKKENSVDESEPKERSPQRSIENSDEVVAEVSSTSAIIEALIFSDCQQENGGKNDEMEAESSDNVSNILTSEKSKVSEDGNQSVMEVDTVEDNSQPSEGEAEIVVEVKDKPELVVHMPDDSRPRAEDTDHTEMVVEATRENDVSISHAEIVVEVKDKPELVVHMPDDSRPRAEDTDHTEMVVEATRENDVSISHAEKVVEVKDKPELVVHMPDDSRPRVEDTDETEMVVEATRENDVSISHKNKLAEEAIETQKMDVDVQNKHVSVKESSSKLEETSSEQQGTNISSWAEVKKYSVPLTSHQESKDGDKESDNEEDNEITPLVKPKDCKTIGSVLAALQIFQPISKPVPEDTPRLKISFDLYLATEFKKSHRGLPHYRIVVFSGSEPIPSPAQVREVLSRFEDSVPVLRAVVTAGSVVFYKCAEISLPVDDTSYTE